ncbi:MAG: NAD(P)/FAD-dependent oxidoreductase [Vicinamibacteria bacterium]
MRDLAVIGGGPAGLATAIFAAREGLSVSLFEQRRFPIDKACGEGLMPHGVRLLSEMGVRTERSHPFEGIRYIDRGLAAEARFQEGFGLGIRRTALSEALVERARDLGVEVRERTRATAVSQSEDRASVGFESGVCEAKWLVVADGLGSLVRGRSRRGHRGMRRYGYRRHYRIRPWSSFVEVHWGDGAEAYVTPVGAEEVGVALLWHERAPSWDKMLSRFPELAERLRDAPTLSSLRGAGPFRRRLHRVTSGRLALVGDSSGYVDAITGEGVAIAFECADALVRSLKKSQLGSYERAHRRANRRYRAVTSAVLLLARHRRLRRGVVSCLARSPRVFERLLALSHSSP